ncbi:MAG TPA: cytochrome c4 [Gammaproteobacteria bacterium]|nr:cytochrome c4 [Gammaproteobacteria bacterium]
MKKLISLVAFLALAVVGQTLQAAGNAAAGKAKSAVCAGCHGPDGNSAAPNFPKIAGMDGAYIAKQLEDFKKGVRKDPMMAGMVAGLSRADMDNLGAYFASQKRNPGKAGGSAENIKTAEKLYRGGSSAMSIPACMGCHGPAGAGIPARYPAVSGQHAAYSQKQLNDFKSGARSNDGGVMGPIAARLSDADIKAVSEYMAGLH